MHHSNGNVPLLPTNPARLPTIISKNISEKSYLLVPFDKMRRDRREWKGEGREVKGGRGERERERERKGEENFAELFTDWEILDTQARFFFIYHYY